MSFISMQHVLRGVVQDFVEDGSTRSIRYFDQEDLVIDDAASLPADRCVRVTFEYASISEMENNSASKETN